MKEHSSHMTGLDHYTTKEKIATTDNLCTLITHHNTSSCVNQAIELHDITNPSLSTIKYEEDRTPNTETFPTVPAAGKTSS